MKLCETLFFLIFLPSNFTGSYLNFFTARKASLLKTLQDSNLVNGLRLSPHLPSIILGEIDKQIVIDTRHRFPFLNDR